MPSTRPPIRPMTVASHADDEGLPAADDEPREEVAALVVGAEREAGLRARDRVRLPAHLARAAGLGRGSCGAIHGEMIASTTKTRRDARAHEEHRVTAQSPPRARDERDAGRLVDRASVVDDATPAGCRSLPAWAGRLAARSSMRCLRRSIGFGSSRPAHRVRTLGSMTAYEMSTSEVDDDVDGGGSEDEDLQHGVVALLNDWYEGRAEAAEVEDRLGEHRTGQQATRSADRSS